MMPPGSSAAVRPCAERIAWKAAGHALSTETPTFVAKTYVPRPAPDLRSVGIDEVAKASAGGEPRILDVRPADGVTGIRWV